MKKCRKLCFNSIEINLRNWSCYGFIHSVQKEVVHCLPDGVIARANTGFICFPKEIISFLPKEIFDLSKEIIRFQREFDPSEG